MNQVRRKNMNYNEPDNQNQVRLMNFLRQLWEQHVMWTRSYIISNAENIGDLDYVTKRLLENPSDFAKVLQAFYGSTRANEFKNLLEQHLLIASQLVNAAKIGDSEKVETERAAWYANADQIADYLSQLNPYWIKEDWRNMLYSHLKLTEDEAIARLSKQYANDIALYDFIQGQALEMADDMARGLIKQFGIR